MKKIFSLALILILAGVALAAELQPIAFPFIGRWNPSEEPALLDDYGLQDIQNVRKVGKHFKGIGGHTIINSTSISAYPYFLNGFHFWKDQPVESHVIVSAAATTTSPGASYLYQNTTAIPGAGAFSATTLHTDATAGIGRGRFSLAPAGNMVYSNGAETLIWGGSEIEPVAFIAASTALTGTSSQLSSPIDYSDGVRNTRTTIDQVAYVGFGGVDSYTMFMLHMDGTTGSTTFTNSSTVSGSTVTVNGNAQISMAQSKFGGASGYFDGTGDYLTIADATDSDLSSGTWTIDFWVNKTFLNQNITVYYQETDSANHLKIELISTSSGFAFYPKMTIVSASSNVVTVSATTTCNQSDWYHVAFVQSSGVYYGFVNGALIASVTDADNPANYTGPVYIGSNDTPAAYHKGYLDEFRLSKGIARWTSAFTPWARAYGFDQPNWLLGFYRPIQGAKFYLSGINVSASTITADEWNGSSWTSLTVTDGTAAGGVALAQTGSVTFSSTENTSNPKYINGLSLYWYQFSLSAGAATIYYVTVDAPIQPIRNIWNGAEGYPTKFLKYVSASTTHVDYTKDVIDDLSSTYADFSGLTTATDYAVVGFTSRQQGFNITMKPGSENSTSSTTMTISYWNGAVYVAAPALSDGTAASTTSLSKSGVASFQAAPAGTEFQKAISDELPLYYYKLSFGATLDADTKIAEIRGIRAPPALPPYSFSETFQNRLFLFNEYYGEKNKAIYSGANTPDIFNGSDSSYLYFGDKTEIIAAKAVYNVFRTFAAEQLIVTKKNETWRVSGDGPTNWVNNRMSDKVGCVAPLSMVTCEVSEGAETEGKKQVIIWQSDKGFVMTDGAAIIPISDDIRCYFDANDSRAIPTTRKSKTVAWYDPFTRSYKVLISSGTSATYHNIELEYSLTSKEWTKIYREDASGADPLQCGFQVFDTNGLGYTYGGNTKGYLYRLENGATFAGTSITNKIQTKDLILDAQIPLFRKSTAKFLRVAHKKKTGSVTVAHYGDQVLTVSGSTNQTVPAAFSTASTPYNSQSCMLGPFLYHSFLFTSITSTNDGMELSGLAIYSEPQTVWR